MLVNALRTAGLRSTHLQVASFGAIALCLGLWPPMLWLVGDSLQVLEG